MFEIRLKGEYIYMLKFEHLEGVFLEAKEHGYCVAIEVTIPGQEQTEFILNRAESIDNKLEYYKNAYDDNLVHKHCKDIRIVDAVAFKDLPIMLTYPH